MQRTGMGIKVLAVFAIVLFPAVGSADFNLTGVDVSSTAGGEAIGTAEIGAESDGFIVPTDGFLEVQDVTPEDGAMLFQEAYIETGFGTASASTSVDSATNTQSDGDNTVTAAMSGSASAEGEGAGNEISSFMVAAGGSGQIEGNLFFDTRTGFMLADADILHSSLGIFASTSNAQVEGNASVAYRFAGQSEEEKVSVSDASVSTESETDFFSATDSMTWVQGLVAWTDDLGGVTIGSAAGVNSNMDLSQIYDAFGPSDSSADASGQVNIDFTYRPVAGPLFSFTADASGSAEADAGITQGSGDVSVTGGQSAVGRAGTSDAGSPLAMSWIAGSVAAVGYSGSFISHEGFAFNGNASAVSPANLEAPDADPVPNMTVTSQFGTYSAAVGSSSTANASAEAQVEVTADDTGSGLFSLSDDNQIVATAVGFSQASRDWENRANIGDVILYDLAGSNAFTGTGAVVGLDEPVGNAEANASAQTQNLYGSASSPDHFGTIEDGSSETTVGPDDEGVYQRSPVEAGASRITADNYITAVSHNLADGIWGFGGGPDEESGDLGGAVWWQVFADGFYAGPDSIPYDNLAGAFIGGGGN